MLQENEAEAFHSTFELRIWMDLQIAVLDTYIYT